MVAWERIRQHLQFKKHPMKKGCVRYRANRCFDKMFAGKIEELKTGNLKHIIEVLLLRIMQKYVIL